MKNLSRTHLAPGAISIAGIVMAASQMNAAVVITALDTPLVFDFQSFTGSGFSPNPDPSAGQLDSDNWSVTGLSDGDVAFGGTKTTGDFARGTSDGGVATGGVYAFKTSTTNTALGIQPIAEDFTPGSFILRLENKSLSAITNLSVSYDLFVLNNDDRSNSFNFGFQVSASDTIPPSFNNVAELNYTSEGAKDASAAWTRNSKSTNIPFLSFEPDEFLFLRWTGDDVGGSGSRDEFALDNISITVSAVPEISSTFMGMIVCVGLFHRRRRH